MSFLGIGGGGNLFSSIANIALQGALGVATGGASLLVTTALKSVLTAVGDQVLQQLGQQLGLPQGAIDLAQAAFHSAAGDPGGAVQNVGEAVQGFSDAAGLDNFQAGQAQRDTFDAVDWIVKNAQEELQAGSDAEGSKRGKGASALAAAGGGESFLVKLAIALGTAVDNKMNDMLDIAKEIDNAKSNKDESKVTEMSAKMTAYGQEANIMSNALNTSLKTIGEAIAGIARKQ
ncbi:hypothetical protein DMC25_12370 [Caulobacter sp. D4A]|uniref:hypothetical protein n=1 Tax=unclassified Caulobacter TaxID=2648921 RepID=UPI000D72C095|nr:MULTISPECIES: hypothetical protein [unclassified Caulobacter]PXA87663.1 hypothetical protein DMC25_12370 [Caulobacter sp. D4A]PXA89163.1 hypothetical protein DMC18_17575 [Caulobacter sp. D5]